jgi:hypothetical protein
MHACMQTCNDFQIPVEHASMWVWQKKNVSLVSSSELEPKEAEAHIKDFFFETTLYNNSIFKLTCPLINT